MTRSEAKDVAPGSTLSSAELERTDAYWRAANYLSVGQIYLFDNPLLNAATKSLWPVGGGGLLIGAFVGWLLGKRGRRA